MWKSFYSLALIVCLGLAGCGPSVAEQRQLQRQAQQAAQAQAAIDGRAECERKAAEAAPAWEAYFSMVRSADAGPLPSNWQNLVKAAISRQLKDPDSAQFRFEQEPSKAAHSLNKPILQTFTCSRLGFIRTEKPEEGPYTFHWRVVVMVNAKNSYGGYTGFKRYLVSIENGKVFDIFPFDS